MVNLDLRLRVKLMSKALGARFFYQLTIRLLPLSVARTRRTSILEAGTRSFAIICLLLSNNNATKPILLRVPVDPQSSQGDVLLCLFQ
jgi:hypothetical protein